MSTVCVYKRVRLRLSFSAVLYCIVEDFLHETMHLLAPHSNQIILIVQYYNGAREQAVFQSVL